MDNVQVLITSRMKAMMECKDELTLFIIGQEDGTFCGFIGDKRLTPEEAEEELLACQEDPTDIVTDGVFFDSVEEAKEYYETWMPGTYSSIRYIVYEVA